MLGHESEPFPDSDGRVVWCLAFALKILVGQLRENLHRFGVHSFEEGHYIFVSVGEFFAVRGVAGGPALHVFAPHITFRYGKMPQDVAEGELSRRMSPVDFVRRDAARYAHGAFANISKVA